MTGTGATLTVKVPRRLVGACVNTLNDTVDATFAELGLERPPLDVAPWGETVTVLLDDRALVLSTRRRQLIVAAMCGGPRRPDEPVADELVAARIDAVSEALAVQAIAALLDASIRSNLAVLVAASMQGGGARPPRRARHPAIARRPGLGCRQRRARSCGARGGRAHPGNVGASRYRDQPRHDAPPHDQRSSAPPRVDQRQPGQR